jgi:hypothetical protein
MQRARRLVAVVAVALVGSFVLAGCKADPTVAAYVGKTKITEKQVSEIVDDFNAKAAAAARAAEAQGQPAQPPTPLSRDLVVSTMVMGPVCEQLQLKQGFAKQTITVDQIAQQEGAPVDSTYAKLRADAWSCLAGMQATGGVPTDEELRDIYDRAVAAGLGVPAQFEDFKQHAAQDQTIQQYVAINRALGEAANVTNVTVNPRYRPLEFALFAAQNGAPVIVTPLGEDASGAVRDS